MRSHYADQMKHDPAFAAFIEAQIGMACVDLAGLKIEMQHAKDVIEDQKLRIRELEKQVAAAEKMARRKA